MPSLDAGQGPANRPTSLDDATNCPSLVLILPSSPYSRTPPFASQRNSNTVSTASSFNNSQSSWRIENMHKNLGIRSVKMKLVLGTNSPQSSPKQPHPIFVVRRGCFLHARDSPNSACDSISTQPHNTIPIHPIYLNNPLYLSGNILTKSDLLVSN